MVWGMGAEARLLGGRRDVGHRLPLFPGPQATSMFFPFEGGWTL